MTAQASISSPAEPAPNPPADGAAPSLLAMLLAAVVGLVIVATAVGIAVTRPAPALLATNSRVDASGQVVTVDPGMTRCQHDEVVPAGTDHLRLYGAPEGSGPAFRIEVRGTTGATHFTANVADGWTASPLDVPLRATFTVDPAFVCITDLGRAPAIFAGNFTPLGNPYQLFRFDSAHDLITDDVRIDYRTTEHRSYLSQAGEVARRFALYKPGPFGSVWLWIVIGGTAALGIAAIALVIVWTRNGRDNRARWAALACAVIATGHAWAWAITTPPFQVPDEAVHISYVDYLASHGRLPPLLPLGEETAPGSTTIYALPYDALWNGMPFSFSQPLSPSQYVERATIEQSETLPDVPPAVGPGTAAGYPPLYYTYEAIADRASAPLTPLNRIYALRLWSGLLLGVTAAGVFAFLREIMPGRPWTWVVGALAVALQPMTAFIVGGVNNDALVYALAAWMFALVARCFRLGVTRGRALTVGLLAAAALMTKPTAAGILPGIGLGLLLAARRDGRRQFPRVLEGLGGGGAAFVAWIGVAVAFGHRNLLQATGFGGSTEISSDGAKTTLVGQIQYVWQYYLPKLPSTSRAIPAEVGYPLYDVWFHGFVGLLGWAAVPFPIVVEKIALAITIVVGLLAVVGLVRARGRLRGRLGELGCYALAMAGLLGFIAYVGYHLFAAQKDPFEQTRYLFPLLALYGAVVATAASSLGRRWGPLIAVTLVSLMTGHALLALLLSVRHFSA